MPLIAPPATIAAPPRLLSPFGAFSVVPFEVNPDVRWFNGVQWEALACDNTAVTTADCNGAVDWPSEWPDNPGIATASTFTALGLYKCSPGSGGPEVANQKAETILRAREQYVVEGQLWAALADAATTTLTGGTYVDTLGQIEQFIADHYGGVGIIHASRRAISTLMQNGAVVRVGDHLETAQGTLVLAGGGFPGTSSAGVAPASGHQWVAASPLVFGFASDYYTFSESPGDLLDRGKNDLYGIAARDFLMGWEPCGVAFANLTLGAV